MSWTGPLACRIKSTLCRFSSKWHWYFIHLNFSRDPHAKLCQIPVYSLYNISIMEKGCKQTITKSSYNIKIRQRNSMIRASGCTFLCWMHNSTLDWHFYIDDEQSYSYCAPCNDDWQPQETDSIWNIKTCIASNRPLSKRTKTEFLWLNTPRTNIDYPINRAPSKVYIAPNSVIPLHLVELKLLISNFTLGDLCFC